MNFHPAANIFPLLEGADFAALVADMAAHGQREPIVTHAGMILDGRNRWRACVQLGLPPVTRAWVDDGDAVAYVVSTNLHRRHLNESQRAMVAARLANMRQGERTDIKPSENFPKVSQATASETMKVSDRSLRSAKTVLQDGAAEVVAAVDAGQMPVSAAVKIVTESVAVGLAMAVFWREGKP